jgi:hypothetical protein
MGADRREINLCITAHASAGERSCTQDPLAAEGPSYTPPPLPQRPSISKNSLLWILGLPPSRDHIEIGAEKALAREFEVPHLLEELLLAQPSKVLEGWTSWVLSMRQCLALA